MEGAVHASQLTRVRQTYSHIVDQDMREQGYLPVLDLESSWWVEYDPEKDQYNVRYADQAMYYGKEDIDRWAGWLLGELIPTTKKPLKT
jgi:hypothetical protein